MIRNRCSVAKVAALFAFLPPSPPLYSLVESDAQKSPKISIKTHVEELQADPHYSLALDQVSIHMMETKLGERIPGFLWTNPNAKFTILFSHGNAMDCAVLLRQYLRQPRSVDRMWPGRRRVVR